MEYKECFVPSCKNSTTKTPEKIIVRIREDLREQWCRAINIEYYKCYTQYCCEDHFDPEVDLKNYMQVKLIDQKPVLKPTAKLRYTPNTPMCTQNEKDSNKSQGDSELAKLLLLSPSEMQTTLRKRKYEDVNMPCTSGAISSQPFKVEEDLENFEQYISGAKPKLKLNATLKNIPRKVDENAFDGSTSRAVGNTETPNNVEVAVQVSVNMADKAASTSFSSSKHEASSETKLTTTTEHSSSTPVSESPSLFSFSSESEESKVVPKKEFKIRKINLEKIKNKSEMYLGLPKQYIWLIDNIVQKSLTKIDSLSIIVTLLKIKQNDSIERISDELEISRTKLSTMLLKGIEVLGKVFKNFILSPPPKTIKRNLPLIFKISYSNVQMIIDCFEIQIAKPSNPIRQAQTWSQYKSCNTVKYLIGCTPDGLISFISEGYGGCISDKEIVEKSNLINCLQPNSVVLADLNRFKEIECLLSSRGVKLLSPPSVNSGVKQTKAEALQSKIIASLRVHVEHVIRYVREFSILRPRSVVNYKYVPYLDEIVVISCGLINLR